MHEIAAEVEARVSIKEGEDSVKISRAVQKATHFVSIAKLRREMEDKASQFIMNDELKETCDEGRGNLSSHILKTQISDSETAQLYRQFCLFDIDADGFISLDDLVRIVSYIDPKLAKEETLRQKCQNWFGQRTFYPNSVDSNVEIKVSFEDYVFAVLAFRTLTEKLEMTDVLNFPFWSLRDCVICSQHRHLNGWAWKRGSGNVGVRWQRRHFRMCKDPVGGSKISLEYYDNDEDEEELNEKRVYDLRQLSAVTFSPKTSLPTGEDIPEKLTVFKLLFNNNARVTLCCEPEQASEWTAIFSNYALAGRLITEWRIQYGNLTMANLTIRDKINCGQVIVSMQQYASIQMTFKTRIDAVNSRIARRQAQLEKEGKKLHDFEKNAMKGKVLRVIKKTVVKCYKAPKERLILKVCGVNEDELEKSFASIQCGIYCFRGIKDIVWTLDDAYLFSGIRTSVFVIKNGIVAYRYGQDAKNAYKARRYGVVEWQDKMLTRDCGVCKAVFVSVSTKAEKKKHHCRSCGRVVCHSCSTNQMYFEVSQKIKRVCDQCLVNGSPVAITNPFEVPVNEEAIKAKAIEDIDDDDEEDLDIPEDDEDEMADVVEIKHKKEDAKKLATVGGAAMGEV